MIVGVFATWDLSLFEQPDVVFKRKLEENSTYPFTEIRPNVYMLTVRSKRLIIGTVFSLVTALAVGLMYGLAGSVNEYIPICIIMFVGFIKMAIYYREARTFVLDGNEKMYEFYRGDNLVYRGHYHNIYIRLKGEKTGSGDIYYKVTLNGFHVDEEVLTGASTTHSRLFKLGRRIAHRLDLNFFDYQDRSKNHVIRNQCPYLANVAYGQSTTGMPIV